MAGLQSIPDDLYESSELDGASSWMRFTNVTVPMLGLTLLFVIVVLTIRAFQAYGEFDLLTQWTGGRDDDDDLPDLRRQLGDSQRPRSAVGRPVLLFPSSCSPLARAVPDPRTAGALAVSLTCAGRGASAGVRSPP